MAAVIFLSSDLMFTSRVVGAAKDAGVKLGLVADPATFADKLTADCRLVIVDLTLDRLNLPAVVRAVKAAAPAARVIAYGAHVDQAGLTDASEAGCDQVLTRGQFHQDHAELLRSVAAAQ